MAVPTVNRVRTVGFSVAFLDTIKDMVCMACRLRCTFGSTLYPLRAMCKCCNKIEVRENLTIESRPREARTVPKHIATRKDEDAYDGSSLRKKP